MIEHTQSEERKMKQEEIQRYPSEKTPILTGPEALLYDSKNNDASRCSGATRKLQPYLFSRCSSFPHLAKGRVGSPNRQTRAR